MVNFLGLDSINVLKDYIDAQVAAVNGETRIVTIQAYQYIKDTEPRPITPDASVVGGTFDVAGATYIYPKDWGSLYDVLFALGEGVSNDPNTIDYNKIDERLAVGSIWMTVGVIEGNADRPDAYSAPVKISGQNGVSIKFKYSYDPNSEESDRTENPQGPSAENPVEYVWTKVGDAPWAGPSIFAMYAESGKYWAWQYCVTSEDAVDADGVPIIPGSTANWTSDMPTINVSSSTPYMWHRYQIVVAGENINPNAWSTPVLFGHYGKDGNVPDYTYTIYCKGNDSEDFPELPGIVAPAAMEFVENQPIEFYLKDGWVELPEEDDAIWWQCSLMVDGHKSVVTAIGAVKRYNAIDGIAKPGPYTKYLYCWSSDQTAPVIDWEDLNEDSWSPKGWYERPDYDKAEDWKGDVNSIMPDASLWCVSGTANGLTAEGHPNVDNWSEPYKLTGPRGPISYDYRVETRYMRGSENGPQYKPEDAEWYKNSDDKDIALTPTYPYLWAVDYLVYYKMKYADEPNDDGTYDILITDDKATIVKDANGKNTNYGYYRLSGLNGADGSKKNTLKYSKTAEIVNIDSFMTNYYVSNSADDVTYKIVFNFDTFIEGYTAKFANIGTGNVILETTTDTPFTATEKTAVTMTLSPRESVELICYKDNEDKILLVIGKSL